MGRGPAEKPKDFGGVMKKLIRFLPYSHSVIIIALVAQPDLCLNHRADKLRT